MTLSPKLLFRQNEDHLKAFKAISHNNHFQQALSAAMAEFAQNGNSSSEQIAGARKFVNTLLNLSEDEPSASKFPVKTLDYSDHAPKPEKKI